MSKTAHCDLALAVDVRQVFSFQLFSTGDQLFYLDLEVGREENTGLNMFEKTSSFWHWHSTWRVLFGPRLCLALEVRHC